MSAHQAGSRRRGATLIEALTYRVEAHTTADDAARYRADAEVQAWLARDPITRLAAYLTTAGLLDEPAARQTPRQEQLAVRVRDWHAGTPTSIPPTCSRTCTPGRPRPWNASGQHCPPSWRMNRR